MFYHSDQEYNAHGSAVGDPGPDEPSEANAYQAYRSHSLPRGPQGDNQANIPAQLVEASSGGATNTFFEQFDPMMDADPFGLTASMHFETPFSYAQNQNRQ